MDLVRGFNPAQLTSLRSSVFYPNLMVFIDWPGDPLRFSFREEPIVWDGNTWTGFGPLAELSLPSESPGIAAESAVLSIAGVDHDLDGKMDTPIRGRMVQVYLALMANRTGANRIGDPVRLFSGTIGSSRMKTSKMSENETMSRIEVDLSTGPSARAESSIYHTDEDQRKRYPTDTAGRLVIFSRAKAQKLRWPE